MQTDLDAAMQLMPRATDRDLVRIAIDPSIRGFSRLEFLGDAILGLAVFAAGEVAGFSRPELQRAVSNAELRQIIEGELSETTSAPTGDVVETLIGAIHLSVGFNAAARWAVHTCLPAADPVVGGDDPSALAARSMGTDGLVFIGAAAIGAVVAEHLCTGWPTETQRYYSDTARRYRSAIKDSASDRVRDWVPGEPDQDALGQLRSGFALAFLEHGWPAVQQMFSKTGVEP